jgi:hypothetical protein
VALQNIAHGLVADRVTQLEQFAFNPLNAPVVLAGQPYHQPLDLPVGSRSSSWMALLVRPLEADQLLVPTEKRGRFHDPNDLAHHRDRAPRLGFQLGSQYLWWVFNASGRDFPSSRLSVVMVQPTENWNTNDGVIGLWLVYSSQVRRIRNTVDTLMGTSRIEVVDVFAHQSSQMTFTENDDMIQTLASDTTDETLARRIGFRCAHGYFEDLNMAGRAREVCAKLVIIVADQKPWSLLKRRGFT